MENANLGNESKTLSEKDFVEILQTRCEILQKQLQEQWDLKKVLIAAGKLNEFDVENAVRLLQGND
jgi:hypothetical protein